MTSDRSRDDRKDSALGMEGTAMKLEPLSFEEFVDSFKKKASDASRDAPTSAKTFEEFDAEIEREARSKVRMTTPSPEFATDRATANARESTESVEPPRAVDSRRVATATNRDAKPARAVPASAIGDPDFRRLAKTPPPARDVERADAPVFREAISTSPRSAPRFDPQTGKPLENEATRETKEFATLQEKRETPSSGCALYFMLVFLLTAFFEGKGLLIGIIVVSFVALIRKMAKI